MFAIPFASDCPRTRGIRGRIYIPTNILLELTATLAVEKGHEWGIVLTGERRANGREVIIDGFVVPDQDRTMGTVKFNNLVVEPNYVCVLHSHHGMGAFFSDTDVTDFNKKFGASIVVSTKIETDEGSVLGFEYKAVGKVLLECGTLGLCAMSIVPTDPDTGEIIEDWPEEWIEVWDTTIGTDLGDCPKANITLTSIVKMTAKADCGLEETYYAKNAFIPEVLPESRIATQLPKALAVSVKATGRSGRRSYKWDAHANSGKGALVQQIDPYEDYYRSYADYLTDVADSTAAAVEHNLRLLPPAEEKEPKLASTIPEWRSRETLMAIIERDPTMSTLTPSQKEDLLDTLFEEQVTFYSMFYETSIKDDISRTADLP